MNPKLLYFALMINSLSMGILITVFPLNIKSMGVDSVTLGFIFSVYSIAFIPASPIWGKMSDIWGKKLILVLGMSGYSLTILCYSFINDPLHILFIRLLQGFTDAPYWTVPTALAADIYKPDELGDALGKIGISQGIGNIAGPLVGGILIEEFSYSSAFYFCSALTLLAVLLVLFGVHVEKTSRRETMPSSKIWSNFDAKMKRSFIVAYFNSMLPAVSLGVVTSNFSVHADAVLEGNKFLVGLLLTSYYFTVPLIQPIAGKLSDIIGRRYAILIALATCGFGFFTLIFASSFVSFLIAIVIVGAGVGQLSIALKAALMMMAPTTQRGFISGLQSVAWGMGYFLGPTIGGIVTTYFVDAPYAFCAVAAVIGGILILAYYTPDR